MHCISVYEHFRSELLRRERGEFDGEYLTPVTEINIGPFLESTKVVKCPIGQVRERLSEREDCVLDKKQLDAVECIVKNRLAIVQVCTYISVCTKHTHRTHIVVQVAKREREYVRIPVK